MLSPKEFGETAYANRQGKAWLKWPFRAEKYDVVYTPTIAIKSKRGDVTPWLDLTDNIFGEHQDWFNKWCAIQFQRPTEKLLTSVLCWGEPQGTGKTMIGRTLGALWGDQYSEIGEAELVRQTNLWAARKKLVMVDDMTTMRSRKVTGLLKRLITQEKLTVYETKNKTYQLPDYISYYLTSNYEKALRLQENWNRRWLIIEVDNRLPQSFYKNFVKWRGSSLPALLDYFLNLDISGFDPKADAPIVLTGRDKFRAWLANNVDSPGERDVFSAAELKEMSGCKISSKAMAIEMAEYGIKNIPTFTGGKYAFVYAIRNHDKWQNVGHKEVVEHYKNNLLHKS